MKEERTSNPCSSNALVTLSPSPSPSPSSSPPSPTHCTFRGVLLPGRRVPPGGLSRSECGWVWMWEEEGGRSVSEVSDIFGLRVGFELGCVVRGEEVGEEEEVVGEEGEVGEEETRVGESVREGGEEGGGSASGALIVLVLGYCTTMRVRRHEDEEEREQGKGGMGGRG
ncbi:hypothetical protein BDW22DRAFT_676780 [Trametopsis cervina]|nr:hypothetical protein BDW22DRAFT_676780 [Trametopsis cervina]